MNQNKNNVVVSKSELKEYFKVFYQGNKIRYFITIIVLVLFCLMQIFVANIMQLLTDVAVTRDMEKLISFILLSIIYILLLATIQTVNMKVKYPFLKKAMNEYKKKAFVNITKKNVSCFNMENTGSYISVLTNDANSIEENYLYANLDIIKNIVLATGALSMMFYYNWSLTLVVLISSFIPLIVSTTLGSSVVDKEKMVSNQNESFVALTKDLLSGFSVIKGFSAEQEITNLFINSSAKLEDSKCKRRTASAMVGIVATVLSFIAEISVFIYGAWLVIDGKISVGVMIAFVQLMNYIVEPISQLPTLIANRKSAIALIEKFILLTNRNQIIDGTKEVKKIEKGIIFENVRFAYSDEEVLKNINFSFEKGKSYAIVGSSGSGKSTLLNMILGSYDSYDGQIRIDDIELKDMKRNSLYNLVSMIQQNVFIFNNSIEDNITMFKKFDKQKIANVIEQSGLIEVMKEKGDNYLCGENGINLSGGEKQRISIARSLLKDTSVLLMDEGTSSLDAMTAKNVENAILDINEVTRIVVTHRLDEELLRRYDNVIVMRNGKIEEVGIFDELLAKRGYFFELYDIVNNSSSSI